MSNLTSADAGARTESRIPIICYHAIEYGPAPMCLPPQLFERHAQLLVDKGAVTLTMSAVAAHLRSGQPFPPKAVALTFDDGFASVHTVALPVLADAGMIATVFPVTAYLGGHSRWIDGAGGRLELMGATQLAELASAGWEIGGHTHTHPALPRTGLEEARDELARSSAVLEELTGRTVTSFAYPYGWHDAATRRLAGDRYESCVTIGAARARLGSAPDQVERIDAWYVRRPWQLRHLHDATGAAYLGVRRLLRAGRGLVRDAPPGAPSDG